MSEAPPARPAVVIIGGGYGGINVARQLDDVTRDVLVEPKDAFVHNVAALRALVNPPGCRGSTCPTAGCSATAGWCRTGP